MQQGATVREAQLASPRSISAFSAFPVAQEELVVAREVPEHEIEEKEEEEDDNNEQALHNPRHWRLRARSKKNTTNQNLTVHDTLSDTRRHRYPETGDNGTYLERGSTTTSTRTPTQASTTPRSGRRTRARRNAFAMPRNQATALAPHVPRSPRGEESEDEEGENDAMGSLFLNSTQAAMTAFHHFVGLMSGLYHCQDQTEEARNTEEEQEPVRFECPQIPKPNSWDQFVLWKQRTFHSCSRESNDITESFARLDELEKRLVKSEANLRKTMGLVNKLRSQVGGYVDKIGVSSGKISRCLDSLEEFAEAGSRVDRYRQALDIIPGLRENRKLLVFYRQVWDRKARKNKRFLKYLNQGEGHPAPQAVRTSSVARRVNSLQGHFDSHKKMTDDLVRSIEILLEHAEVEPFSESALRDVEWKLLHAFQNYVRRHRTSEGEALYASLWTCFAQSMASV